MNTRCLHFIIPFLLLLLTGCNDDIFIDDVAPSNREIVLTVGEEESFKFQSENLVSIQIRLDAEFCDWAIYDMDGKKFNDYSNCSALYIYEVKSSLPLVGRATASNENVGFEFIYDAKNSITVKALENLHPTPVTGTIILDYTYKSENVRFSVFGNVASGLYQIVGLTYDKSSLSRGFTHQELTPLTVKNLGTAPITQTFNVEERCMIGVSFSCPTLASFTLDPDKEMPEVEIPTYRNDGSSAFIEGWFHGDKVRYSTSFTYAPPLHYPSGNGLSFYAVYPVTVPPMSAAQAVMTIDRINMVANAILQIRNTTTGRSYDLSAQVGVSQPFLYTFKWQEIPLEND